MPKPLRHVLCLSLAAAGPASAQAPLPEAIRILFDPGASEVTLEGRLTGQQIVDYILGARAGQTVSAEIDTARTDGDGTVYFNVLPPGESYEAIFVGQTEGRAGRMSLAATGDYTIRVYLKGNDRDTDRFVGFTLHVSIE